MYVYTHTCSYAQSKDIDVAMKTNTGSYTIQRQTDRQTARQTDRQRDRETKTETQRDSETERERERETDRQTETETETETETDRERERESGGERDRWMVDALGFTVAGFWARAFIVFTGLQSWHFRTATRKMHRNLPSSSTESPPDERRSLNTQPKQKHQESYSLNQSRLEF